MKRAALTLAAVFCLLVASARANAQTVWTSVRTQNFLFVGDVGERDLHRAAAALEEFRTLLPRVFPQLKFESRVTTTIIVFGNDETYTPFKPVVDGRPADVAGFFQSGEDKNYITLHFGAGTTAGLRTLRHEYMHLLVKQNLGSRVPTWFEEGLAEVYSTFDVEGRVGIVGRPVEAHLRLIKTGARLPLKKLFTLDGDALRRESDEARRVFYAQSWAIVHYLLFGDRGREFAQIEKFIDLVRNNSDGEAAFREAFELRPAEAEAALESYLRRDSFRAHQIGFEHNSNSAPKLRSAARLTEPDVDAHLGDLLLHLGRVEEAEARLLRTLARAEHSGAAQTSLGMLRLRQNRFAEARKHLHRARELSAQNYLAHYYYGLALSREAQDGSGYVSGFDKETLDEIRAALRTSIRLNEDFPESYALLAWVNMVASEQLDEAFELIMRAISLSPGKPERLLVLAQIQLRRERFDEALRIVEPLMSNADAQLSERARMLVESVARARVYAEARARAAREEAEYAGMTEDEMVAYLLRKTLRKPLDGEERASGVLTSVECVAGGAVFNVRVGERLMRLRDDDFAGIHLVTYTSETGRKLTCGPRAPENHVVVTYRPRRGASDGEIVAVEFVPAGFQLNP